MSFYHVLDTRGLLLHAYHRSQRKTIETTDGFVPSWEDGLVEFITEHLDPILKIAAPRQILACFDGGNNARRKMYVGYKAKRGQRDRMENPVKSEQIRLLLEKGRRFLAYLGCRTVQVPGEEADDLIALLVTKLEADSFLIYTRDGDLLQLVNEKVSVSRIGKVYGIDSFMEASLEGVPFDLIVLMKAITGDSTDEYPGIKGCGPKFFGDLLAQYGNEGLRNLDAIVRTGQLSLIEKSPCNLIQKLVQGWQELTLFYRVAKVDGNHCYGSLNGKRKVPEWYVRIPNRIVIHEILTPIGLFRPEWDRFFPSETLIDATQTEALQAAVQEILASPIVSYDYETSDKRQHGAFREYDKNFVDVLSQELCSVSINYGQNLEKTIYVPFDHASTANYPKEWAVWLIGALNQVLPRPVVQNAAFELAVTQQNLGFLPKAPFDTAIMAMYVDENEENGLKAMSQSWLNYKQTTYKEVTQGRMMCELTANEALSYGCDDSLVTGHLFDVFRHILQLEGSWAFYAAQEVDWAVDSTAYFLEGTDIDFTLLDTLHQEAKARYKTGMETMHAELAEHCNAKHTQATVMAGATVLLDEWWLLKGRKFEPNDPKGQATRQALWEKAWKGCYYVAPSQRVAIKFSPTAAQLTAVALLIDKALPRIAKTSVAGITEWDLAASDAIDTNGKSRVIDPLAKTFAETLYAARSALGAGKRSGPAYAALETLCLDVLQERGNLKAILEGDQLSTNSTDQMQMLLYGKLQLPIRRRSKVPFGTTRKKLGMKGGPSTGIKAVQAAFVHDVIEDTDWRRPILNGYLEVAKTSQEISLYFKSYPLLVHPIDGRIHPQIKNCGTATRRPSGTAPNVLQVAKGKLRTMFRAGDYGDGERVYVCADWAAEELVILACESKDATMLSAFSSTPRKDLHSLTSTSFAHIVMSRLGFEMSSPPSYEDFMGWLHQEENPDLQASAKTVRNKYGKPMAFAIAYGASHHTLAENLLIPLEFAKELMQGVFRLYSRIQPWQQETADFAMTHGYTETAWGNRRHAPSDLWSTDKMLSSRAQRQLTNSCIQSTAADILKVVLTEMNRREMRQRYRLKALRPVYDEITASVPIELAVAYSQELVEIMSVTPPGYPVGMQVDLSIGKTWGTVREVGATDAASVEKTLASL